MISEKVRAHFSDNLTLVETQIGLMRTGKEDVVFLAFLIASLDALFNIYQKLIIDDDELVERYMSLKYKISEFPEIHDIRMQFDITYQTQYNHINNVFQKTSLNEVVELSDECIQNWADDLVPVLVNFYNKSGVIVPVCFFLTHSGTAQLNINIANDEEKNKSIMQVRNAVRDTKPMASIFVIECTLRKMEKNDETDDKPASLDGKDVLIIEFETRNSLKTMLIEIPDTRKIEVGEWSDSLRLYNFVNLSKIYQEKKEVMFG